MGRNPNWKEEELILALELYISKGLKWLGRISDTTEEIVVLSTILKGLDFYGVPISGNFRSVGSVRMKLGNFKMFDPEYEGGSLSNAGRLDNEIWNKYAHDTQLLSSKSIQIINDHYKGRITAKIRKYIDRIEQSENKGQYNSESDLEIKMVRSLLDAARSKGDKELSNKYSEALSILEKRNKSSQDSYHEHGGINQALIKEKPENKIGRHVRDEIRKLIDNEMIWETDLDDFQSDEWSKDILHLSHAFFLKIDVSKDIKKQLRDNNGYLRYWKEIYAIQGQQYAMCKEWFESNRKHFDKWIDKFIKEKKLACSPDAFKALLLLVKELDQKAVCVSVSELKNSSEDSEEIEIFVDYLIKWGVLLPFQGSTREYNIDDYDRFYDMINNPEKYALRDE